MPDRADVFLRPRDLVRLRASVSARQRTPWNLEHPWGLYHRTWSESGSIRYARSDQTIPPFAVSVALTAGPGDTYPRMAYDQRQTLILLFQRANGASFDAYEAQSNDDGATWSTPSVAFAGGKFPTVACSPITGIVARAAWISNQIWGQLQEPGQTAPGTPYVFRDQTGAAIQAAEDTFHLAPAFDGPHRWLLTVRLLGASEISDFQSWDDGQTWKLIS